MVIRTLIISLLSIGSSYVPAIALAANEPIQPIEDAKPKNLEMVELGKMLFFDPRLSKSGFISCNSCHNLSMGGTDNLQTSIGHNWQQGPINSPTVLNSSMNLAQFWDGRAKDLKEQVGGPIANPTARSIGAAPREIHIRHIGNCLKADPAYGEGVAIALGIQLSEVLK